MFTVDNSVSQSGRFDSGGAIERLIQRGGKCIPLLPEVVASGAMRECQIKIEGGERIKKM